MANVSPSHRIFETVANWKQAGGPVILDPLSVQLGGHARTPILSTHSVSIPLLHSCDSADQIPGLQA